MSCAFLLVIKQVRPCKVKLYMYMLSVIYDCLYVMEIAVINYKYLQVDLLL